MKHRFGRLSARLIVRVMVLNLCLILLISFIQILYSYRKAVRTIDSQLENIESLYLPPISNGLFKVDIEQLNLLLDGILSIDNIEYAAIIETTGQNNLELIKGTKKSAHGITKKYTINHSRPNTKKVTLGYLEIYAGFSRITSIIIRDISFFIGSGVFLVLILTLIMFIVFQRMVSQHIVAMAGHTSQIRIGASGNSLELKREHLSTKDELDMLVDAINNFEKRINSSIIEKEKASQALAKSESELSLIVNNVNDLIALLKAQDDVFVFESVNNQFISIFQQYGISMTPEHIYGKTMLQISNDILFLDEANILLLRDKAISTAMTKNSVDFEFIQQYPKGRAFFRNQIIPILDKDGICSHLMYVGHDITGQKLAEEKMLKAIINTEEKEKSRFAKDIHDGLGPILSTAKLYIQSLINEKNEADKIHIQERIFNTLEEAIVSIKEISNNLSPHILRNFGLTKAVQTFITKIEQHKQTKISFDTNLKVRLEDSQESTFYRVITELINNTLKHAQATEISIEVRLMKNKLYLYYTDNGIGFNFEAVIKQNKGFGLLNMQNRFHTLNGDIKFSSTTKKGIKIEAFLPVEIANDV